MTQEQSETMGPEAPGFHYGKLVAPFPKDLIRQRDGGGGKKLDYVAGHHYINRLNAFAGAWSSLVTRLEYKGQLLTACVVIDIPGLGRREGLGVQKVYDNSGEDLAKGAVTDAIKNACKQFGIGIELYEEKEPAPARQTGAPAVLPRALPRRGGN